MRITRVILTCLRRQGSRTATTVFRPNERAPDHQARGSKVCFGEYALCACPIEPWYGQNFTLRIRPEAFRLVMYRRWGSIQHDCHDALLLKKKQHPLQIKYTAYFW